MNKKIWEIFKKTGNLNYYLFLKKLEQEDNENRESTGDNHK